MFRQVEWFCIGLWVVSLFPAFMGLTGLVYFFGAMVLGAILLWFGMVVSRTRDVADARSLLRASVFYLPILFLLIIADLGV